MKILVCDDHEIVREGVRNMLDSWSEISMVDVAEDGMEALALVNKVDFDVVILDIGLPGLSGLEVLKLIKEKKPATRVIILSIYTQTQYATRAFNLKASGYLTKDVILSELKTAIQMAMKNKTYISSTLGANFAKNDENTINRIKNGAISKREKEIFQWLGRGKSNKEIAALLDISSKTVSTYKSRIMEKMNFCNIADLIHNYGENNPDEL